jgi:biotin carboxylase
VVTVAQIPVSRLQEGSRRTRGTALGAAVFGTSCLGFAALVWVPSGPWIPIGLVTMSLYYTVGELLHSTPSWSVASATAPAALRGRYLAVYQLSYSLAGVVAPTVFTSLMAFDAQFVWVAVGLGALLAAANLIRLERRLPAAAVAPAGATEEKPPTEARTYIDQDFPTVEYKWRIRMEQNRLLMVMPYPHLVQKAVAEGFRVFGLWDPRLESDTYLQNVKRYCEVLEFVDFSDEAALRAAVREMAARHRVDYVLHLGREETMLTVYRVAAELGLATNPPEAVRQLNDKAAMRQLLAASGLSPVRCAEVASAAEVPQVLHRFAPPVVVKPTSLAGSRGVALIRSVDDLNEWQRLLDRYGYTGPVLVEEFLDGPEYSVETITVAGRHHVIGVTAKQVKPPPGFVEIGHVHPAPLHADDCADITELVTALLDAAGYWFGPTHTEVILTRRGPRIVESQARLAGDRIPRLVELATGFDPDAAVFAALACAPLKPVERRAVAAISFFQLEPGRLVALSGLDEIAALPYVDQVVFHYGPGDDLPETIDGRTRHGYVIVTAQTHGELQPRIAAAHGLLRASITPSYDRV